MIDIAIPIIVALVAAIINNYFEVSGIIISTILDLTPVISTMLILYKRDPLNYLKVMNMKKRDINFEFTAIFKNVSIENGFMEILEKNLKDMDPDGGTIDVRIGDVDNAYRSLLRVVSVPIEIEKSNNDLVIKSSSSMSFKGFISYMDGLLNNIKNTFGKEKKASYQNLDLRVRIRYIRNIKTNKEKYNPYVEYIFKRFPQKRINISFLGKYNSRFIIKTDFINVESDDFDSMSNDIKDTMTMKKRLTK